MNDINEEIEWVEREKVSPEKYLTLYFTNKQIYINKKLRNHMSFSFNYVKLGINKKENIILIKPISPEDKENYSLVDLTDYSQTTNKFLNPKYVDKILDTIKEDIIKKYNSIRIKAELKEDNNLGLIIIGDLNKIYPN